MDQGAEETDGLVSGLSVATSNNGHSFTERLYLLASTPWAGLYKSIRRRWEIRYQRVQSSPLPLALTPSRSSIARVDLGTRT